MRMLCLGLLLFAAVPAGAQTVSLDEANRMAPSDLFRQLLGEVPFEVDHVYLEPAPEDRVGHAVFWSRARPSENGVTCETDTVTIYFVRAEQFSPISGATLYRALNREGSDPAETCAEIPPRGLSFFRASTDRLAGDAVLVLRDILQRANAGNMRGMTVICEGCKDPHAALTDLENETLLEVIEERCAPDEGILLCLEYRFLGDGPYGGWRMRTDRNRFVSLVHYGGINFIPPPPPPPPRPNTESNPGD
jgi:hypothetical protein